ncbi:UDP-glucuronosyltransferase 2B15-like [Sarcophilus harrisii]|uniref:UDP-glucuronosyltransferase 2B15-like n=1 Tax=Sarcophilus harrisii TaxID=9305 RepID=UPI0013020099|nr:UDP-glucuronosyltransferase 2B15-like [Sarcophilus harrisii]
MRSEKWVSALWLLQLSCFSSGFCGKVLVWPMEYSHWINLKAILDGLLERGHEVTVLTPSATVFVDPSNSSRLYAEVFPVRINHEDLAKFFENLITIWSYEWRKLPPLEYGAAMQDMVFQYSRLVKQQCELQPEHGVVISDAICPCAELIAEIFGIPFIYSLRFSMGNYFEKYCGGLPFPPSYVPVPMAILTPAR